MPGGEHFRFTESTPGRFTPPATRREVLVRNTDGSFDLTLQKSRTVIHFLSDGTAYSIRDDAGNVCRCTGYQRIVNAVAEAGKRREVRP